jgi:hypothetical protein
LYKWHPLALEWVRGRRASRSDRHLRLVAEKCADAASGAAVVSTLAVYETFSPGRFRPDTAAEDHSRSAGFTPFLAPWKPKAVGS